MTISYLITVCDEHIELETLLNSLVVRTSDEVVILFDTNKVTAEVLEVIQKYKSIKDNCLSHSFNFNGDFSEYKNFGKSLCTKDWIFQIDADELLSEDLMESLPEIINDDFDLLYIPRINTVKGITEHHLRLWGWSVSTDDLYQHHETLNSNSEYYKFLKKYNLIVHEVEFEGKLSVTYKEPLINFPDHQSRLFRNLDYLAWEGKVHETIKGARMIARLPSEKVYCILHPKSIERQERQNNYYSKL